MGDDNEIRDLIRRESDTFLQKALHDSKDVSAKYDFESEFAKTRGNRSLLVWGATAATILALGAAAYGVTRIIERQAAAAPVDIRAFADLNLKDLLDTAKRNENDMAQAKQELSSLDYDYRTGLDSVDETYQAAAESIKARNMPSVQERRELAAAAAARDAAKRKLRAGYLPAAAAKKAEIAAIQTKMDSYDQRLSAQAKQQQAVLDSQRQLFDLQMKKQTAIYTSQIADLKAARARDIAVLKRQRDALAAAITARYNPVFDDARSAALLDGWKAGADQAPIPELPPYLENQGFMDAGSSARLDQSLSDFRFLAGELRSVPYLNSVPPALSRMESEALSAMAAYRTALAKTAAGLEERDARIVQLTAVAKAAQDSLDRYRWAVSEFLRARAEGGFVLDPRDPSSIVVALNPALSATDGSTGYIVRDDKIVAHVSFYRVDGALRARVTDAQTPLLKAFDTVVLDAAAPAQPPSGGVAPSGGAAPSGTAAPSGGAAPNGTAAPSGGAAPGAAAASPASAGASSPAQ
ncbi:MAG TPA: hypothetical protein VMV90_01680 [Rectinemataceae bacterium]|nr:hypothetical protein [Rectinemataceae bacterium]